MNRHGLDDPTGEVSVPRRFFGTTAATRQWWTEIVESAWTNGGWGDSLENLELVSIDSMPGPIIVWNIDRKVETTGEAVTWSTDDAFWQVNWILESVPVDYDEFVRRPERHFRLVMDAMCHGWFCLGLLEGDPRFLPFLGEVDTADEDMHKQVTRPFLRGFLRWLPALARLDDRIATASGRYGVNIVGVREQLWMIMDLLYFSGAISQEEWMHLLSRPLDVVVTRLCEVHASLSNRDS